jgi:glycosyltransferase involved in cell wall biosynthesis
MTKVLFFGTHPIQYNGYSKVVYELARNLAKKKEIDLTVYGFQRFNKQMLPGHRTDTDGFKIYDAQSGEGEDKKTQGFGINEIIDKVSEIKPDICIIYNDMLVISNVLQQLINAKKNLSLDNMKMVAYVDQVYLNQKKDFIKNLNNFCDHVITFTEYWDKNIKEQGMTVPTTVIEHGFNPQEMYPVDKAVARKYFNMNDDDFIILNLNRNQPRKRWDTCLKAFAEIVSRHPDSKIKLLIATNIQGAWNLLELYERELGKRNVSLEDGIKHLIVIDRPQQMSDFETNILYNVADIGINTCDGEGFGLCNFEQAGLGIPQIVPKLGGFVDFFKSDYAELIEPKMSLYVDSSRDAVAGEALLTDYIEYVEAIEKLYSDSQLRESYAVKSREHIIQNYKWEAITEKLYDMIYTVIGKPKPQEEVAQEEEVKEEVAQEVAQEEEVAQEVAQEVVAQEVVTQEEVTQEEEKIVCEAPKKKTKKDKKKKKASSEKKEIELLKQQIALLMARDQSRN